jgi:predicted nucleic acid-binding protein
MRFFESAWRNS